MLLIKKITDSIAIIIMLLILISCVDCYSFVINGCILYSIYILGVYTFLSSFIICLLITLRNKLLKCLCLFFVISYSVIWFLIDIFCYCKLGTRFNESFAGIILGTNLNEVLEFLGAYLDLRTISIIFIFTIAATSIYFILSRFNQSLKTCLSILIALLSFGGIIIFFRNPTILSDTIVGKSLMLFNMPKTPDIKSQTNPTILGKENKHPQNIVLIVGESFSKLHSSLYCYSKKTNPRLEFFKRDSSLVIFSDVTASSTTTIESFQYFMSTYDGKNGKWYEQTTIPEVLGLLGYKTYWMSNQSKAGLSDNVIGKFSELYSKSFFVGNRFEGGFKSTYDEEILKILDKENKNSINYNFYTIHLMGSHEMFNKRYPSKFSIFNPENYLDLSKEQRQIVAEYDNSVLYNDYIVSSIIDRFKNKESVIIYFPDHSLDIYNSSPNYYGHSKKGNKLSEHFGKQIPFMIYFSPKYKSNYPNIVEEIKEEKDSLFNISNVIYLITKLSNSTLLK